MSYRSYLKCECGKTVNETVYGYKCKCGRKYTESGDDYTGGRTPGLPG